MNYPSVLTLMTGLSIDKQAAEKIREYMREQTVSKALRMSAELIPGASGVEFVPGTSGGVRYINMGDTYATTLLFDYKKYRFYITSWGEIVEAEPNRFNSEK